MSPHTPHDQVGPSVIASAEAQPDRLHTQPDRYRLALELAREHGWPVTLILPTVNGVAHRLADEPPVTPLSRGGGYALGYLGVAA